jgi:hypothetical protein
MNPLVCYISNATEITMFFTKHLLWQYEKHENAA